MLSGLGFGDFQRQLHDLLINFFAIKYPLIGHFQFRSVATLITTLAADLIKIEL